MMGRVGLGWVDGPPIILTCACFCVFLCMCLCACMLRDSVGLAVDEGGHAGAHVCVHMQVKESGRACMCIEDDWTQNKLCLETPYQD